MSKLKEGDRIFVQGFVMLQGLESGTAYQVAHIRDYFGNPAVAFRRVGGKKIVARHYLDSVETWIRDLESEDLNKIIVERVRAPIEPVGVVRTGTKMDVTPEQTVMNPFGLEGS